MIYSFVLILFLRKLRETNGLCLGPVHFAEFWDYLRQQQRQKVLLLFGYLTDNRHIRNGNDAAHLLLEVIETLEAEGAPESATPSSSAPRSSSSTMEQQRGIDGLPTLTNSDESSKKPNRSYGNECRSTDIVKQDEDTGVISEVLATRLPSLILPVEEWIDRINDRLRDRLALSIGSTIGHRPQIRLLGRYNTSATTFHAEMDVTHRRVEYLLPADFLYGNGFPNTMEDWKKSRKSFFQALPFFADETNGAVGHDCRNGPPSSQRIRPELETLQYMHTLKKIMKIFAATENDTLSLEREHKSKDDDNENYRANPDVPKKTRSRKKNKFYKPKTSNASVSVEPNGKQSENAPVSHSTRRRRFHNFSPTALAHEYLAYRKMDRLYHRATLRYKMLPDGTASRCDDDINQRPFLVISMSTDMFLTGQATRMVGVIIAIIRGLVEPDIMNALFDEQYPHLFPTPPAPHFGLYAVDAHYANWEGKLKAILSPRKATRDIAEGFCNEATLRRFNDWREEYRQVVAATWLASGIHDDGRLVAEQKWTEEILEPWTKRANEQFAEYRTWKALSGNSVVAMRKQEDDDIKLDDLTAPLPLLESIDIAVPVLYEKVLFYLRQADASGSWPATTPKRQLVMVSTVSENATDVDKSGASTDLVSAIIKAKSNKEHRMSAYAFVEGEGGASGSFSVGAMPGEQCTQPKANLMFPELMKAAFELELVLRPDREPSSTIAINRNAQFRPHTDIGAGAGQSRSLIVGLGDYVGGELVVEGEKKDIRYKPVEFNGWKQRHWTMPFKGERYSLVWFTPKGCEGVHGIDLCQ